MIEGRARVLLIEDNRDYAALIEEYVHQARPGAFDFDRVERLAPGLERLERGDVDLVLLDLTLPDSQGLDTFLVVQECAPDVPVVVLTGLDDEKVAIDAAREGAQDYLVKGQVTSDLLMRCMLYALERHQVREKLKQVVHALEASEARFRGVIENSVDGVVIVDGLDRILFVNPAAVAMLGRPAEDLLGSRFAYPLPDDRVSEIEIDSPDGEPLIARVRAAATRWDDEAARLVWLRDVTERRRIRHLENRLEEEGLLVARLRELDRMKSEFVQTVTHELRTPMTPLNTAVEMFLDGTLGEISEPQRQMLELMGRNIRRLSRFAGDVLSLARLDEDEYPLQPRYFDLRGALNPTVGLQRQKAERSGMSLAFECAHGVRVFADPDAVAQVLTNLLDNAITHNERGTSIAVRARAHGEGLVRIEVQDDGCGIPTDATERLFDRFVQARRESGPGYRGTGIGLAVSRSLVEKMGGTIVAESAPGDGATFRFTVPAEPCTPPLLFGRIATGLGLVDAEEVLDVVEAQGAGNGDSTRLGDLLVARGRLTSAQRDEVLAAQASLMTRAHPRRPDRQLRDGLLGQMAVQRGLIDEHQLHTALRALEEARQHERPVRLGQVLVERGLTSNERVLELLMAQGQRVFVCSRCGGRFNALSSDGSTESPCPRCSIPFGPACEDGLIAVDQDA